MVACMAAFNYNSRPIFFCYEWSWQNCAFLASWMQYSRHIWIKGNRRRQRERERERERERDYSDCPFSVLLLLDRLVNAKFSLKQPFFSEVHNLNYFLVQLEFSFSSSGLTFFSFPDPVAAFSSRGSEGSEAVFLWQGHGSGQGSGQLPG